MKRNLSVILALIMVLAILPLNVSAASYTKRLTADKAFEDVAPAKYTELTIKGSKATYKLTLPATLELKGDLILDNLTLSGTSTIYANGFTLEIKDTVTSDSRLTVYGGCNAKACNGTDLRLYGGKYQRIYGGGAAGGTVNGNTNVVVGGNVNPGDGIDDQNSSTISPCYVYGGGNNSVVNGATNVTLKDNAVVKYLVGAGVSGSAAAKETYINIEGGKVMNVYAGSTSATLSSPINTHINMTGGIAEALFGGCESSSMTGNTSISISGGQVTRRVYTGCYNNYANTSTGWFPSYKWMSEYHVSGTTTLILYPGAQLNTKFELDSENQADVGVYSGSRHKTSFSDEINTLVFADDSYSALNGKIGNKDLINISSTKSHHSYLVKASSGGDIYSANASGKVYAVADNGNYVENIKSTEGEVTLSSTSTINFVPDFKLNSITATGTVNKITVNVDYVFENVTGLEDAALFVAIYDSNNKLVAYSRIIDKTIKQIEFDGNFTVGNYSATAMIWNNSKPIVKHVASNFTIGA